MMEHQIKSPRMMDDRPQQADFSLIRAKSLNDIESALVHSGQFTQLDPKFAIYDDLTVGLVM